MKKHVIAAAVAAAFVAPAMAQNVTISGSIDTAYISASNNASSASQSVFSSGALSTNTLTMSGTEDLGGGMKAYFKLNTRYGSDETIATYIGDRGALVGIKGSFGDLAVGKSDGSGMNGLQGGLIGNQTLLGAVNIRPDNSASYTTPTVNGLTGRLLYSVGNETASAVNAGKFTEVSASYVNGPLTVKAAQSTIDGTTARDDTGGAAGSNVANSAAEQTGLAVTYDAGFATLNARTIKTGGDGATAAEKGNNTGFGVSVPVASGMNLVADIQNNSRSTAANTSKKTTAGVMKSLSKRTTVYALWQSVTNNASATTGPFGVTAAAGADNTGFALGIKHSF